MNFDKVCALWRVKCESAVEKFVLVCIGGFANKKDNAWPSIKSICERTQLSERSVQRAIRSLEAKGFIKIIQGGGKGNSNEYRVLDPKPVTDTPSGIPRITNGVSECSKGATQSAKGATQTPEVYRKSTRRGQSPPLLRSVVQKSIDHAKSERERLWKKSALENSITGTTWRCEKDRLDYEEWGNVLKREKENLKHAQ